MLNKILIKIINLYQKTLSPDHSWLQRFFPYGYCQFHPSCSQYAKQTLEHRPFIPAVILIASRLIRCNPWSKGGFDPVIKQ